MIDGQGQFNPRCHGPARRVLTAQSMSWEQLGGLVRRVAHLGAVLHLLESAEDRVAEPQQPCSPCRRPGP